MILLCAWIYWMALEVSVLILDWVTMKFSIMDSKFDFCMEFYGGGLWNPRGCWLYVGGGCWYDGGFNDALGFLYEKLGWCFQTSLYVLDFGLNGGFPLLYTAITCWLDDDSAAANSAGEWPWIRHTSQAFRVFPTLNWSIFLDNVWTKFWMASNASTLYFHLSWYYFYFSNGSSRTIPWLSTWLPRGFWPSIFLQLQHLLTSISRP